ncbi:uncharacterized protein LOC135415341 [Pseudopipra pipra]|uniref:uncharacterized protein LOC135415341 n=1 Tax=Pseudopipra pipra TaxID=415032 RepID=UPI0031390BC7
MEKSQECHSQHLFPGKKQEKGFPELRRNKEILSFGIRLLQKTRTNPEPVPRNRIPQTSDPKGSPHWISSDTPQAKIFPDPRTTKVGKGLQDRVQAFPSTSKPTTDPCPPSTSTRILNPSRNEDSTTGVFQCLTTLSRKEFSLISNLNLPWSVLRPFTLILSLVPWEQSPIPPGSNIQAGICGEQKAPPDPPFFQVEPSQLPQLLPELQTLPWIPPCLPCTKDPTRFINSRPSQPSKEEEVFRDNSLRQGDIPTVQIKPLGRDEKSSPHISKIPNVFLPDLSQSTIYLRSSTLVTLRKTLRE